jgi:hypothetical protein
MGRPLGSLRLIGPSLVSGAAVAAVAGGLAVPAAVSVATVRHMTTLLISRALDGGLPNAASTNAVISGDQRWARVIAYESAATNLVP